MKNNRIISFLIIILVLFSGCAKTALEMVADEPAPYTLGSLVGTVYLTADGDVYTRGTDRSTLGFYQTKLGQGEGITHCEKPVKILSGAVKATTGLALKKNGELWVWGDNSMGCSIGLPEDVKAAYTPVLLMKDVVDFDRKSALKLNGELWGWSWTAYADPVTGEPAATTPVKIASNVISFCCNTSAKNYGAFIKKDGSLWIYGNNVYTGEYLAKPVKLTENVVECSADEQVMFIKSDGSLWGFGNNECGQVGNGDCGDLDPGTYDRVVGEPIHILDDVAHVYAKAQCTFAVTTDGTLYGWGRNFYGMLGADNGIERSPGILEEASYSEDFKVQPSPVVIARDVKNLYLPFLPFSGYYTDNNDALWAWGGGTLGTGEGVPLAANVPNCAAAAKLLKETEIRKSEPVQILENIRCVVGDDSGYTYALAMDGTYYRWGVDTFTRAKTYGEANVIVFCTFKPDGTQDKVTGVWSSLIDTGYAGELGEPGEEIAGGIGYVYSQILTPEPCEFPG